MLLLSNYVYIVVDVPSVECMSGIVLIHAFSCGNEKENRQDSLSKKERQGE